MLSKLNKYGPLNSIDAWKCLAILTMFIDHAGMFFFAENIYLRAIGRLSAPIWFFFVGMHFDKGSNKTLLIYGLVMAAALSAITQKPDLDNVLLSVLMVKLILQFSHQRNITKNIHYIAILWAGFAFMFITIPFIEYGSIGFLFAYCGYLHKIGYKPRSTAIFFAGTGLIYLYSQQWTLHHPSLPMLVTALALIPLMAQLYRFKYKTYQSTGVGVICMKFLSRYSMEIYLLHLVVLTAITHYTR